MKARQWRRHPHRVQATFIAVALASFAALAWLSGLLLKQDEALEAKRQRVRLEQSAARAVVAVQRTLADLQALAASPPPPDARLPDGVSLVTMLDESVTVRPEGSLRYYPVAGAWTQAPADALADAEHLEFVSRDLRAAAREYSKLGDASQIGVRASALVGLARVLRGLGDSEGALAAYDRLATLDGAAVDDVPAGLLAFEGRARVFVETGRGDDLRRASTDLLRALHRGQWRLLKSQYPSYAAETRARLGDAPADDADAVARAEAIDWLWRDDKPY